MWYVGQKVVCVKGLTAFYDWETVPKINQIYTIRDIIAYDYLIGLRFEEVLNPIFSYCDGDKELCFCDTRFRPVKETNIDIFLAMLNPAPTGANLEWA